MKLKKYSFVIDTIDYQDHVLRPERLKLSFHTSDAICRVWLRTSTTELRSFIEACNLFRQFVPGFAQIAALLIQRMKKHQSGTALLLNSDVLDSLKAFKAVVMKPLALALPYANGHLTVVTNACNAQFGSVLPQNQPDDTTKHIGN